MKKGLDVSGLADVFGALKKLGRTGEDAIAAAVPEIAADVQDIARGNMQNAAGSAPPGSYPNQQSGKLARSVQVADMPGRRPKAKVGTDEIHGYFLEFGTESMEPRPWLKPSFDEAVSRAEPRLRAEFEARNG